jgi:hypothetical protein
MLEAAAAPDQLVAEETALGRRTASQGLWAGLSVVAQVRRYLVVVVAAVTEPMELLGCPAAIQMMVRRVEAPGVEYRRAIRHLPEA